jgi:hypothetical protein
MMSVKKLVAVVDSWQNTYRFYRPHESLKFLTPVENLCFIRKVVTLIRQDWGTGTSWSETGGNVWKRKTSGGGRIT